MIAYARVMSEAAGRVDVRQLIPSLPIALVHVPACKGATQHDPVYRLRAYTKACRAAPSDAEWVRNDVRLTGSVGAERLPELVGRPEAPKLTIEVAHDGERFSIGLTLIYPRPQRYPLAPKRLAVRVPAAGEVSRVGTARFEMHRQNPDFGTSQIKLYRGAGPDRTAICLVDDGQFI